MFQRTAIAQLKKWSEKENRKPLILRGVVINNAKYSVELRDEYMPEACDLSDIEDLL